jgi:hypothetical protein
MIRAERGRYIRIQIRDSVGFRAKQVVEPVVIRRVDEGIFLDPFGCFNPTYLY